MQNTDLKIKYVLMDFDGTVADTYFYYFKTLSEMCPNLKIDALSPEEIEEHRNKSFKDLIHEYRISFSKVILLAYKIKSKLNKDIETINIFPGIKELLEELNTKDIRVDIVSINSRNNIEKFLKKESIEKLVTNIWSTASQFGKSNTLRKAIRKSGFKIDQIIYLGDEIRDIEACKKVGIKIAAVSWGFNSEKALRDNKADFILDKPSDLWDLLN